jgi:hypothetical protein
LEQVGRVISSCASNFLCGRFYHSKMVKLKRRSRHCQSFQASMRWCQTQTHSNRSKLSSSFSSITSDAMSGSVCARCLFRQHLDLHRSLPKPNSTKPATRPFHSSSARLNVVKKKTSQRAPTKKYRENTSARLKKNKRERPRPPAVGERKALRKRIVLSNTNALDIRQMSNLTAANMADESKIGDVLGLEGTLLDQLRAAKAFKTTQNWNLFRKPGTLVRKETVEMGRMIQDVNRGTPVIRQIIAGERSSGKSLLLLQAMSMAYLNGWIVLNVPEGMFLILIIPSSADVSLHSSRAFLCTELIRATTAAREFPGRTAIHPT